MFELYTEKARRVIFFARYEASRLGGDYIESEHLLLGLMREDKALFARLKLNAQHAIQDEIEKSTRNPAGLSRPTSVDMPLSQNSRLALSYAAEEANELEHKHIGSGHLLLGLLRIENCGAASVLKQHGINLTECRDAVLQLTAEREGGVPGESRPRAFERLSASLDDLYAWSGIEPRPAGVPMQAAIAGLAHLIGTMLQNIQAYSGPYSEQRLKRKSWSRKEALGHLIDWGMCYQQWLTRALTEATLHADEYPQDEWVSAQKYADFSWTDLVDLWLCTNQLLMHVLAQVTEEKARMQCKVGIEEPITLLQLVDRYIAHCDDIVGQMLAHL
ncbi:MAG: hypothetical protein JOY62_08805 [Acidobacteriaceae bacterium]|nr:hypothetical protein [Acidobacteriaceae bacterium]MBV9780059.1 hypothetical protein [Acidobacteriaceae bacterium]